MSVKIANFLHRVYLTLQYYAKWMPDGGMSLTICAIVQIQYQSVTDRRKPAHYLIHINYV